MRLRAAHVARGQNFGVGAGAARSLQYVCDHVAVALRRPRESNHNLVEKAHVSAFSFPEVNSVSGTLISIARAVSPAVMPPIGRLSIARLYIRKVCGQQSAWSAILFMACHPHLTPCTLPAAAFGALVALLMFVWVLMLKAWYSAVSALYINISALEEHTKGVDTAARKTEERLDDVEEQLHRHQESMTKLLSISEKFLDRL